MTKTVDTLPDYLRQYCVQQHYDRYTPEDHAAWRFIMKQNLKFFSKHAVSVYEEGLKKTGIPIDRIPKIEEMDRCLQEFGWGAVPVCGFIPPAAFLEFQARGVLAIAADMRSVDHVDYTPAPDIVHEAAGHAPILADADYRAYLKQYAAMAQKAIMSREDLTVYEAIRVLSDIKENPDTKPEEIEKAEQAFIDASKAVTHVTEATKVSRMAWWTVEYGLVGPLDNPKIYGAGLLSSVGESQACLSDQVKKIPLTVDCVEQTYDITEPQPQLFVAKDMKNLVDVLHDLEETLSFKRGGEYALKEALQSQLLNTFVFDSGAAVSGTLREYEASSQDPVVLMKLDGPLQYSIDEDVLSNAGRVEISEPYFIPLGKWTSSSVDRADIRPDSFTPPGELFKVTFKSGFSVRGDLHKVTYQNDKPAFLHFKNARVLIPDTKLLASYPDYILPVGSELTSVHGGPASKSLFGSYDFGKASTQPGRTSEHTPEEKERFELFEKLRLCRNEGPCSAESLDMLYEQWRKQSHWLVGLELLELAGQAKEAPSWTSELKSNLETQAQSQSKPIMKKLMQQGVDLYT